MTDEHASLWKDYQIHLIYGGSIVEGLLDATKPPAAVHDLRPDRHHPVGTGPMLPDLMLFAIGAISILR